MNRRVTPPKRVTSPTWGPSPPCKQALKEIWAAICLDGPKLSWSSFLRSNLSVLFKARKKFHIYPSSIRQKYDFNSCLLYSKKAKYLNSDLKKKELWCFENTTWSVLEKMSGCPSFEMSFFQKSDVIWSLGRYPCVVLGLVYGNQEKHFWALLIPKHKSSIKLGNILL